MVTNSLIFAYKRYILLASVINFHIAFCSIFSFGGDSWITLSYSDSISSFVTESAYIPHLSRSFTLSDEDAIDFEFSERLMFTSDQSYSLVPYRAWVRYTTSGMDIRVGLQKISFGPSQVLRSIAWFDNIDIKNPLALTEGVNSFRVKNYFSDSFNTWFWMIESEMSKFSLGGRGEYSTEVADIGLTLHRDEDDQLHTAGQFPILLNNANTRVGIDARYDGFIGLWNETAIIVEDKSDIHVCATIGLDYTLPYLQGIHFLFEHLNYNRISTSIDNQNIALSSFMVGFPIGIFNNIMFITTMNWDDAKLNHYMKWSHTLDDFGINFMASTGPTDMNNILQIMLTFNH